MPHAACSTPPRSETDTAAPSILIVNDRPEELTSLREALGGVNAGIVEASNGNQALAATLVPVQKALRAMQKRAPARWSFPQSPTARATARELLEEVPRAGVHALVDGVSGHVDDELLAGGEASNGRAACQQTTACSSLCRLSVIVRESCRRGPVDSTGTWMISRMTRWQRSGSGCSATPRDWNSWGSGRTGCYGEA